MTTGWPFPRFIAHRGGGSLAPENTLGAIRLGQSLGYRAHEIDVKLSRDNVAFLLHDATLQRTTGAVGRAADLDWENLRVLDAGSWHSEPYRGEPLPSFDAAAALLQSKGTLINVEIKPTPGIDRETGTVVARRSAELWKDAPAPPLLSSFSLEALVAAKEAARSLPRGWLTKEITPETWEITESLGAVSLHTDHRTLDRANIQRAHERGMRLLVYTVNDPGTAAQLLAEGVDMIVTDNLADFARRFPKLIA